MTHPSKAETPEIEALIKAIEEDGLPVSMAMGEMLRSLNNLSQTLISHKATKDTSENGDESIAK